MTVMTSPENKEFNRHLWTRLWPAYYKRDVDQGHHGMIIRHNQSYVHCTTREEVKLVVQWKKEMCHRGRRAMEIKLHHPHCHSELLLITRDCLPL